MTSRSEEHTGRIGAALGSLLREGDVLALHGNLGAGKTCLVRGIAVGMGLDPGQVSSPTFVIVNEYTQPRKPDPVLGVGGGPRSSAWTPPLIHVDAYRLSGPDDLDSVGWDRVMDGAAVVVVEWAERIAPLPGETGARSKVPDALGDPAFVAHARLTPVGEHARRMQLDVPPAWAQRKEWRSVLAAAKTDQTRCPTCGKTIEAENATAPFCTEKCRLADLGRWFSGQYTISRELREDDLTGGASGGAPGE